MVQTDLMSDNLCDQNEAAASYFWVAMDPIQRGGIGPDGKPFVQYGIGETGLFTGVGLHSPARLIDVSE